jgi:hypothetical protein
MDIRIFIFPVFSEELQPVFEIGILKNTMSGVPEII